MVQVRIEGISGATLPVNVYISDVYGNYNTFLGTISSAVPPTVFYNNIIPTIFQTAPEIMLTLIDDNECTIFKIIQCDFGCAFEIIIDCVSCVVWL